MHNLIRIYNQNRIKIWIIVIGIIISITVIQNLNKSIRDENNKKNNKIILFLCHFFNCYFTLATVTIELFLSFSVFSCVLHFFDIFL